MLLSGFLPRERRRGRPDSQPRAPSFSSSAHALADTCSRESKSPFFIEGLSSIRERVKSYLIYPKLNWP